MSILTRYLSKSRRYALRRWVKRIRVAARIRRVDSRPVPDKPGELRLFMAARNEALRLPFIIQSYLERGVDRIFVLDNDSTDETPDIVLAHRNAHLFHTRDHYRRQPYWIDYMLRRYGTSGWSLVVDADEVLIYPDFERLPLRGLCEQLDRSRFDALDAVLLDMYPDIPLQQVTYRRGDDPALTAEWFDSGPYDQVLQGPQDLADQDMVYSGPARLMGGMRRRVFGLNPCICKFPLVRFNKGMFLSAGAHFVHGARIAPQRGALLHYKYLSDFEKNVRTEVKRGAHWNNASEYKGYLKTIEAENQLRLHSQVSAKLSGSHQLVELGIMKAAIG